MLLTNMLLQLSSTPSVRWCGLTCYVSDTMRRRRERLASAAISF